MHESYRFPEPTKRADRWAVNALQGRLVRWTVAGRLLGLCVAGLLVGCSAFQSVRYHTELHAVQRPERAARWYGDYTLARGETDDGPRHIYEDGLVRMAWLFDNTSMRLDVENKTAYSVRVRLDKGAFRLPSGRRDRLLRGDMSYQERDAPAPPLLIPSAAPMIDQGTSDASVHLLPRSKVDFTAYSGDRDGYGSIDEIIEPTTGTADSAAVRANIGERFSVTLPIETRRGVDNYTFVFEVVGARLPGEDGEEQIVGEVPVED